MRRSSILPLVALAALGTLAVPRDAAAVILQIDGTICPQSVGNIQPGLNKGENGPPYTNTGTPPVQGNPGSKGPIDPVFDAAETPQVFAVPKTGNNFNTVTFIDLLEGAGFENTFGWYNVGDDLSDLNNLHPVLTCAGTNYEPTPAASSQLAVNFQTEFTAGRYKGGFIGFFLVTPEGQSGGCSTGNCGNPKENACVGRIYYTEKQINGDGNYVHFLVYQTKRTNASGKPLDDYYFGFEDLYRGGDNDFEDMLMLVQGLVVPCVPSAEICDGKDNNCDGLIDNSPTDVGADCYNGPAGTQGKGECKAGKTVCASSGPGDTTKKCVGEVDPVSETCDGKDNNCDGTVDNGPFNPGLPNACPPQQGACSATTQCVNGAPACVPQKGPQPEVCNGLDDDCNGLIDDNLTDAGLPCTPTGVEPTIGECKAGTTVCQNKALTCSGYKGPTAEVCDGKDNNCNGQTDENPTDLLAKCAPSGVTVCTSGAEQCINGSKVCTGFTLPGVEVCNGKDDDCNGKADDNVVDDGAPCGNNVGQCKAGLIICQAGKLVCNGAVGPSDEICDNLDNDCDGQIDENTAADPLPGVGSVCTTNGCNGVNVCKDGNILCVGSGGSKEVCDGKDNDCNGVIDDNLTDIGALCGNNLGQCIPGAYVCKPKTAGDPTTDELVCEGGVGPVDEVCDGLDNDCDGQVDENTIADPLPGVGVDCGGAGCGAGKTACINGVLACQTSGGTGKPELCNGLDDDCNGLIDDNPIDVDAPCGISTGECEPGVYKCKPVTEGDPTTDKLVCEGGVGPADEVCDGKDNNCNGKIDEPPDGGGNLPGIGEPCQQPGACGSGVTICKNGVAVCQPDGKQAPETCNGIDDDCNGIIDDNPIDEGQPCGTNLGECEQGTYKCKPVTEGDPTTDKLVCEGGVGPADEVCDGKDNNCNGVVDEDPDGDGPQKLPGTGDDCPPPGLTLPLQGECKPGKTVCIGGGFQCIGSRGPTTEACDGKDNDCDGTIDSPDPCPKGAKCISGQCAQECVVQGEFSNCPGGLSCVNGYCVNPSSQGQGGSAGQAGAGGAAGSGGSAGSAQGGDAGQSQGGSSQGGDAGQSQGGSSQGGSSQGGDAGSGQAGQGATGGQGTAASGGKSGGPGSPGTNPNDTDGDGKADDWGLATGGGGCACSTPSSDRTPGWLGAGLFALLSGALRGRRSRAGRLPKENA